jgi:hypothetical protein
MGPEPTHEELDDLESVAREGPGATLGTIAQKIQSGRGDITSLSTPVSPTPGPINVFVSYAHADEPYKRALLNHLAILARLGVINNWHDGRIQPGTEWKAEIERELARAQIVLLLISADFLGSDFCWGTEMQNALVRHDRGEVQVIPIIIRDCDWQESPLGKLQALPTDGRAIASWEDRDAAFTNVARGIRSAVSRSAKEA